MIKRTVEISRPAHVSLSRAQLMIKAKDGEAELTVPIEDLGVLVLDNAEITHSTAALLACMSNNVAVVLCDGRHLPSGLLQPFEGHTLFQKHLRDQLDASQPQRKQLWQRIIQAKLKAQATTLEKHTGNDAHLGKLAAQVRSGDPDNLEAHAARRYFSSLFGDQFTRNPDLGGINSALNYGYALLRAAVARSIVGSGMHPALGIWHKNQYNAYTLADDLMEPLRPSADALIAERITKHPLKDEPALDREWRT
ncbi:MAG: type II CRISPR-associated endonuclease Cas1, partial [Bacteroidota bacterium]